MKFWNKDVLRACDNGSKTKDLEKNAEVGKEKSLDQKRKKGFLYPTPAKGVCPKLTRHASLYTYKLPMNKTKKLKHKYIPEKFKDVESFTFTTSNDELMVMVFHGFESRA